LGGDRAEELAALAGLHGDGDVDLLQAGCDRLRVVELSGLADGAALLEDLDLLAIG
jgi:hypothetical protein